MKNDVRIWIFALVIALITAGGGGLYGQGQEVGFIEKFALAEDRAEVLKELIPGTEEYYYYHALHYEQVGDGAGLAALLEQWHARNPHSGMLKEIKNRQALLRYKDDPKASLDYIKAELGLSFDHRQDVRDRKPDLPTELDPKQISRDAFFADAMRDVDHFGQLNDAALDWVVRSGMELSVGKRRDLLGRMQRPDYPQLVDIVLADLATKESGGFGEFPIHRLMLAEQLVALAGKRPDLMQNVNYVHARISKMWPSEDEDFADPAVRAEYLARVWAFVRPLVPAFNSLKVHTLYQILELKRRSGEYDRGLFMEYLKLPRNVGYMNPEFLKREDIRPFVADVAGDFQGVTRCAPVQNDEAMVRAYLEHFFLGDEDYAPLSEFVAEDYLKRVFAETKLLAGVGDAERWYSLLGPAAVQQIKDRVEIDFAPENRERWGVEDAVKLSVDVKNVGTLIARVYEVNTLNYYLENAAEITTELNLDGLVANVEETHKYEEPALRRVRREFEFPALAGKRGVWVIELIGNGKSSRALVRKGTLQYLSRTGAAGEVIRVMDDANALLKDAEVWAAGRKYEADEDGEVTVPFSNEPGRRPLVLWHEGFATLEFFEHPSEEYALVAGFHIDREELLTRKTAALLVRPTVTVNGVPTTLKVLEDVKLTVVSTDVEGVSSTAEVKDFEIGDTGEAVHSFRVPERLHQIRFVLEAKVERPSRGDKVTLVAQHEVGVNGINRTSETAAVHMSKIGGRYIVEVLGKTGEPLAERSLSCGFRHWDFKNERWVSLKTDARGRADLGRLDGIGQVVVRCEGVQEKIWPMRPDRVVRAGVIHAKAGEPIQVPYLGTGGEASPSEISLLDLRNGTYTADHFGNVSVAGGYYVIDDLSPGDYSLLLRRGDDWKEVVVRVADGAKEGRYLLSGKRHLQLPAFAPVHVVSAAVEGDDLVVKVGNPSGLTRVHVFGSRFLPDFDAFGGLSVAPAPVPVVVTRARLVSNYLSGRTLGEEYRYVIDRKYAERRPGNMLARPGLLLNPWAIRETETGVQDALEGDEYAAKPTGGAGGRGAEASDPGAVAAVASPAHADLDFLMDVGPLVANLRPGEGGEVRVPLAELGDRQFLRVVAVDAEGAVVRDVALDKDETKFQDVRLARTLEVGQPFAEQKQVTVLEAAEKLTVADLGSADVQTYDTLGKVYALYSTLNAHPHLAEFGFVLGWGKLEEEKKRELYSKYACHELNFFLERRDPEFFAAVVAPYLRNKRDKTFFDDYLTGAELGKYLGEWEYARLNVVEKILLARRLGGDESGATARHIRDWTDLIPADPDRDDHLFETALKAGAMAAEAGQVEMLQEELAADAVELGGVLKRPAGREEKSAAMPGVVPAPAGAAAPAPPSAVAPGKDAGAERADGEAKKAEAMTEEQLGEKRSRLALRDGRLFDQKGGEMAEHLDRAKADATVFFGDVDKQMEVREQARQLYRKMDKTKEWAENNYYQIRIQAQVGDLIKANRFWADYAAWDGKGKFFSAHLAEATGSFPEMMLAMAVLGLPDAAEEHTMALEGTALTVEAGSPLVLFHKEIKPSEVAEEKVPLLVSQNFFDPNNRFKQVGNEQVDIFVTEEFLYGKVYGCQVVVTNPTSARQKVDVLVQIPEKSVPVAATRVTKSRHLALEPFTTQKIEYFFYFPLADGKCAHYPVQVSKAEKNVASAEAFVFNVVEELTAIDKASWDYVSQWGTADEVLGYLKENNLGLLNLDRMAWRLGEKAFFDRAVALLRGRHHYHGTTWSYGMLHNVLPAARQFLLHQDAFLAGCGSYIDTDLVTVDPVARHQYEHLEYSPLVNARAHRLGAERKIVNPAQFQQHAALMKVLSYRPKFDSSDHLAAAYYLLLQDRVEEGLGHFAKVKAEELPERMQYDYFACYAAFYEGDAAGAKELAAKYAEHPVDKWREKFAQVKAQIDEAEGAAAAVGDDEDREQVQGALAATEPGFDFKVAEQEVRMTFQNLKEVTVNYYEMDLEFLFSTNPFVSAGGGGRFSVIKPNGTVRVVLPEGKGDHSFKLPAEFQGKNVLVEVLGGGKKRAEAYYAHELKVAMTENYGRLKVTHAKDDRPLPKAYVKVYARLDDGSVKFYKDGYTDLRGQFDYTSLNTDEINRVERFAVLVMHDEHGALVKEAAPPTR